MRPAVLALAALALTASLAPAHAQTPTPPETQAYSALRVGASCGQIGSLSCPDVPMSHVQFGPIHANVVDVEVHDATRDQTGASWAFYDPAGHLRASGWLCEAARGLHVPPGVTYLVVDVDSPATARHCHPLVSYGTSGNVSLIARP